MAMSRQICGKPLAAEFWPFDEIADHLGSIRVYSFVRNDRVAAWQPHQNGTLANIVPVADPATAGPGSPGQGRRGDGGANMCGTVPMIDNGVRPAHFFRVERIDDRLSRRMEHEMASLAVIV